MKSITIDAKQIRTFGRIYRYFIENPLDDFSNTNVILTGNFTDDCFELLNSYLLKNNLQFNSLTFSSYTSYIPHCTEYLPSKNLIIPEGIKTIKNYSFVNADIKSLELPSTLESIGERAFVNCNLRDILLAYDNPSFTLKDGILKDSLTKQIILKTEPATTKMSTKWYGKDRSVWRTFSEQKSLNIKAAIYWKKYFEKIKPELKQKRLFTAVNTNETPLNQLKMLLQILPDSFGNIFSLSVSDISHEFFPYLMSLQYLTEGKQSRFYPDQSTCFRSYWTGSTTIYCYNSTLLSPEEIPVFFNHIKNGFEMIIPRLQLFIFFLEEELTLIPAFIQRLETDLAKNLEELFSIEQFKDDTNSYMSEEKLEEISQNNRQNILSAIDYHHSESDQKIISQNLAKLSFMANRYNFELNHNWNMQHQLDISFTKKQSSAGVSFTLNHSEILELKDTMMHLIEQELKENS